MSLHHLISINDLSRIELERLLRASQSFADSKAERSLLAGKTVCTLFFEPSTRTRSSFHMAAKALGAEVLNIDMASSSGKKGENRIDTIKNLEAMGVDCFIIRTDRDAELQALTGLVKPSTHIINAGDGRSNHPSQAVLDMLTIRQCKGEDFSALRVVVVGDILHSRVARSDLQALSLLGCRSIRVSGPESLMPNDGTLNACERSTDFNQAIQDADVIMMLRLQHERMAQGFIPSLERYYSDYGLSPERLALAKPDAIVMHPGPMNRGIEIADAVADGAQSVILQQVSNGVLARMAILNTVYHS